MHHRGQQAHAPRACRCCGRQLARQDRDEDDVVDAEDDLEEGQRDEREAVPSEVRKASIKGDFHVSSL